MTQKCVIVHGGMVWNPRLEMFRYLPVTGHDLDLVRWLGRVFVSSFSWKVLNGHEYPGFVTTDISGLKRAINRLRNVTAEVVHLRQQNVSTY